MRLPRAALLVPVLATLTVATTVPCAYSSSVECVSAPPHQLLLPRDGDHHHHGQPLTELNETEVTMYHDPTPPSYYWIDLVETGDEKRHPGLMALHVLFMSLAFFGALPIGIALRSVKHAWHGATVALFYTFVVLGLAAGGLYKKLTPGMYEGSKHGSHGYLFLLAAVALSAFDVAAIVLRAVSYLASVRQGEERFAFRTLWSYVVLDRDQHLPSTADEYVGLTEADDMDDVELKAHKASTDGQDTRHTRFVEPIQTDMDETARWAHNVHRHSRQPSYPQSAASEHTLLGGLHSPRHSDEALVDSSPVYPWQGKRGRALLAVIGRATFATLERSLVFAGLMQTITGIVVYTGGCRGSYLNGCLAHLIRRNLLVLWPHDVRPLPRRLLRPWLGMEPRPAPPRQIPTAEFVESLVIFLYGITNTWMERFGAHPGDPYTTKQMQHISIAVMFWFAGLVGLGIESKRIRRWLSAGATSALPAAVRSQEAVAEPPSYIASFNPFPALCIGITGAAMSAHAQAYLFQVQIHMVWGYLLTGFALLRCITYAFLWLGPPRSILPSRPPTEALAAFLLACGGLEFMFSTEELTIAAMRQGRDDVMMFLNVGVAITCLAFCWTLFVVGFKGWLKSRTHGAMQFHSSA
ncbi:uncharacterized protein BXZ73DRAFT_102753 [Epithele typhae]|uniref:uncharacterized protein n=1 Tax=Epithele typhae TaxID=378194 RepID=UPI0020089CD5|nr:uncharacterized protein BXZ73DRAFT_102753 [Epithele typhae]KAH9927164.1 hypothetical protein BXZ73DRAFT_102753 [Epithele typhae]